MKCLTLSALILGLTLTVSSPSVTHAQEAEINTRAPIIVQPQLTPQAQEKVNSGIFSGIGRLFRPKEPEVRPQSNITRGTTTRSRQGESAEEYAARYMAERQARLQQRTVRNDPDNAAALYRFTLPQSYDPMTHYQGKDGQIYQRETPLNPDIMAKVRERAQTYATQRGTTLEALSTSPRFNQQLQQLYTQTVKSEREAAIRRQQAEAQRKQAEAKRAAEQKKEQERLLREQERERERLERQGNSSITDRARQ